MPATAFRVLNVRPLIAHGVDPLGEIRARLAALPAGQGLTVLAPFLPAPLIELLRSEGYWASIERRSDGWAAHFWRD
ncbi:MAG: DUF2249 domain-containing protein [Opitutaceae bacterium]|nr:DUF2249 domain-containing protein [Opitutaceae bacterium]